jgi:hypothetical protein
MQKNPNQLEIKEDNFCSENLVMLQMVCLVIEAMQLQIGTISLVLPHS